MQSTAIKPSKKPFIRKLYSGHGKMISLPKRVVSELDLDGENEYLQLYYDPKNKTVLLRKIPDIPEDV